MPHVRSTNVGAPARLRGDKGMATGIAKVPVPALEVRDPGPKRGGLGSGVVGDFVGDRAHHGGKTQAVYAVAREELDWWASDLGREMPDGWFGENLTTEGLDVDAAVIGERWAVGAEVILVVQGPRIPCQTFAARMQVPHWVRRFAEHGRSGAYLSIERPGTISVGDPVTVLDRPDHGIDVPTTFRAFLGDVDAATTVLAAGCLDEAEHRALKARIASRR